MQCRQRVAYAYADAHWHTAGLGRQVTQAAHGLGHYAKAGAVSVRASLAIAADAQHDEARVERQQYLGPQSPALHRAGSKVLYQDIAFQGQLAHNVLCFGLLQIKRQRALAP